MARSCVTALVALWLALGAPALAVATGDPADPGPLAVALEEYDLGDSAFQPDGFPIPVELIASVHYPAGLPGGPYPVVGLTEEGRMRLHA